MTIYEICPKCGKKGKYVAYSRGVLDCISFGNKGSEGHCKYCNPRGITKEEKEQFRKDIEKEFRIRKERGIKNEM